ncbi:uncharacterized protein TNCV_2078191 [Trichonephila clavipes]|nr:uncharacterized protein TNCV_2078191 [Trichonephila clavipes]
MCSNITTQHIEDLKLVSVLSIAVDESCDINDTAQVSLFVRFISHSGPEEELLLLLPLKGQMRGEDIANAVIECMDKHHIPLNKIVSISTDGAKSMTGIRKGSVAILKEKINHKILVYHCTVSEALEYIRQFSENEFESDNDEEIVFSDAEYKPPDEKNISSDENRVSNYLVQCNSRKTTPMKKKQCVNKRKKLSDSNPDEMNSGTFVANEGTCWEDIPSGSCMCGRIVEHNVFKMSGPTSYAKQNIENGYAISSWRLLIDEPMLHHIKNCTEEETHWQLEKK